jgi:hypothetical protein
MAGRYAAAHARREQRRRQTASRDYLPLAEDRPIGAADVTAAGVPARASTAAAALRLPSVDYSYLRGDLLRTAVLAAILFLIMVILALVIHV